jgi:hypothetical protein
VRLDLCLKYPLQCSEALVTLDLCLEYPQQCLEALVTLNQKDGLPVYLIQGAVQLQPLFRHLSTQVS